MILSTNPRVSPTVSEYAFPTDVEFAINIDTDAPLAPDGTLLDKSAVQEDVVIRIRFKPDGTAEIKGPFSMFYAGLRDDPFIRGSRMGRNTACIVVQTLLKAILKGQSTLLIWATAKVDELGGPFQDFFGSPFISQFNRSLNVVHPKDHFREFGFGPDVMVLDTSRPSDFPNGRLLTDDVVDMVNQMITTDPSRVPIHARDFTERVMKTDWPFPSVNDLPFSAEFPHLAPPSFAELVAQADFRRGCWDIRQEGGSRLRPSRTATVCASRKRRPGRMMPELATSTFREAGSFRRK